MYEFSYSLENITMFTHWILTGRPVSQGYIKVRP